MQVYISLMLLKGSLESDCVYMCGMINKQEKEKGEGSLAHILALQGMQQVIKK